jgi:hypothetical protein
MIDIGETYVALIGAGSKVSLNLAGYLALLERGEDRCV